MRIYDISNIFYVVRQIAEHLQSSQLWLMPFSAKF